MQSAFAHGDNGFDEYIIVASDSRCPYICPEYSKEKENRKKEGKGEFVDISHSRGTRPQSHHHKEEEELKKQQKLEDIQKNIKQYEETHPHTELYNYDVPGHGYMADIVAEIFAEHGIGVKFVTAPWKRSIIGSEQGVYDAALGIKKNESDKLIFPKEIIGVSDSRFYTNPSTGWRYDGKESLYDILLGLVGGHNYIDREFGEYFKKYEMNRTRIQVMTHDDAIDKNLIKLAGNRLTAIYEESVIVDFHLEYMDLEGQIIEAGNESKAWREQEDNDLFIAFSPNEKAELYTEYFNKGIEKLKKSGRLEEILTDYGIRKWSE